jgi:two-component system chemotaxis response regulator CheB
MYPEAAGAVVAVTLSAGGLVPLRTLIADLPADCPAAIVVAQHLSGVSLLPDILRRHTRLAVEFAEHGELLAGHRVYVCPPDHHIAVTPDARVALSRRERLDHVRPSGDWLLTSAAASYAEHAIAVVLSGMLWDGAAGAAEVAGRGGQVLVQDPRHSEHPDMPAASVRRCVDAVVARPELLAPVLMAMLASVDLGERRRRWWTPFGDPGTVRSGGRVLA